jgi:hypothetical protein
MYLLNDASVVHTEFALLSLGFPKCKGLNPIARCVLSPLRVRATWWSHTALTRGSEEAPAYMTMYQPVGLQPRPPYVIDRL